MIAWMVVLALTQQPGPAIVTVTQAVSSGVTDSKQLIVRTASEWEVLWKSHAGTQPAPTLDFSTDMVAAVCLGTRPTGGFNVEITGARRDRDVLVIQYVERRPGVDDIVAQVLTSPCHIVRLSRYGGSVRFEEGRRQ